MFSYDRYLHFRETDAAGVLYFSEVLNLCHEAYEASLRAVGIDLKSFFSATDATIVPIVHAEVDFFKPLYCGDHIWIDLTLNRSTPELTSPHNDLKAASQFEILYALYNTADRSDRPAAQARTRHVCLKTATRYRQNCSFQLDEWMESLKITNAL